MQKTEAGMRIDLELLSEVIEIYAKHRGQLTLEQTIEVSDIDLEDDELFVTLTISSPWLH